LIEHDPGPRGSPQVPHAPGESVARVLEEEEDTAKVESRRSRSALLHVGQAGSVEPNTIFSKRFPQPRHLYS
jgi:hypothetical protein